MKKDNSMDIWNMNSAEVKNTNAARNIDISASGSDVDSGCVCATGSDSVTNSVAAGEPVSSIISDTASADLHISASDTKSDNNRTDKFCPGVFRPELSKRAAVSLHASVVFLSLIFLCTTHLTSLSDNLLGLLILVTGLPVFCFFLYSSVIRKTVASNVLRKNSLFSWFNGRKFFAALRSFVLAIVAALIVLSVMVSLSTAGIWNLEVLFLGLMIMYATYILYGSIVSRQYVNWMFWLKSANLWLLLSVSSVFMFCAEAFLVYAGIADVELLNGSIAEALAARKSAGAETAVVSVLMNFNDMMDIILRGLGTFIISMISDDYHWIVKTFMSSVKLSSVLVLPVTFLIPMTEYKRIFISPTASSSLPELGFFRVFLGLFRYAVPAAFFMFILCYMEESLTQKDRTEIVTSIETRVKETVEKAEKIKVHVIGGDIYSEKAFEMVHDADRVFLERKEQLEKEYAGIMRSLKRKMYANVDPFLDNYYTLTAEYIRLFGGTFLEGLENSLMHGTETYFNRLGDVQRRYRECAEKLAEAKNKILENTRIADFDPDKYGVIGEISTEDFIRGDYGIIHSAEFRGNFSAALTVLGSVPVSYMGTKILIGNGTSRLQKLNLFKKELGTKITARVMNTPVGAVASKVFGKIATKVLTKAGGAIVGGTIGSGIPVAGTVLGAAVGWFATDYIMLRADEYVNRGELKSEIIKAIDRTINETL